MIEDLIQIIEIFPGLYMWTVYGFEPFAMTWGFNPDVVFTGFALFTGGLATAGVQYRREANKDDCKLQHGDPVDDSQARITLKLTV